MTGARRNACPTLSAPMRTGDGLLARLQPENGAYTPAQMMGLAQAAARHGNGILEITARGSLQIRGLTETSAEALATEVDALALVPRTGVPVETNPLAGLDPQELADPRSLVESLRTATRERDLASQLGPKVAVVVDGGGRIGLGALLGDLRFAAVSSGWQVSVGGTAETDTVITILPEADALELGLGILEAIAARGRDARGRDLVRDGALSEESGKARQISQNLHPAIGRFTLKSGTIALGLSPMLGEIHADTLLRFTQEAKALGVAELRPAPGYAMLALPLDMTSADALALFAARLGLITDPHDPRLRVSACAGAPACASGHLATRPLAREIAHALACGTAEVHVSGCEKRCAEPHAAVRAVGTAKGVSVNGGAPVAKTQALAAIELALHRNSHDNAA
ncbi:precorrin-3B synthase [Mesorhizobium sp. RP14(2022)]|uniref:Precorrin-3B synthase n=1 Tax=Mesorhizobium liriopis TaxID=2953882 RepID=A0ABT1C4Q9_9HYPH|nr:precorrin-3B synthase [Mesorhizobium liriopis]